MPIRRLQDIVTADAAITTFITGLYEKADETSPEGRANVLVCLIKMVTGNRIAANPLAYRKLTKPTVKRTRGSQLPFHW